MAPTGNALRDIHLNRYQHCPKSRTAHDLAAMEPAFTSSGGFTGLRPSFVRRRVCAHRPLRVPRMAVGAYVGDGIEGNDYVAVGVAACFQRVQGKLSEVLILEPLPASAVDCVARLLVPTSYRRLHGIFVSDLSDDISELPAGVIAEGENVAFAENFKERMQAAARTFRRSPEIAAMVPAGQTVVDLNHSVANKRVLNEAWEPRFDDNVKQDKSIDVYNRDSDIDSSGIMAGYNA